MGLETHTIDTNTVRLDQLNNPSSAFGLGVSVLEVEIVVEQLRRGVCLGSSAECNRDKGFSNGAIPDRIPIRAVVI